MNQDKTTELVFATHNPHKLEEIRALMPSNIRLLSLNDIGCFEDIPETSDTIDGNAILKAEFVKNKLGYDCFADDTGLEVKALNGAPGVYSARFAGDSKDSEANIDKLLKEMEGVEDRTARFKTVIALNLNDHELLFTGICSGIITTSRRGNQGFGYDAVFQPTGFDRTFAEMAMREKSDLSHRGKAMAELLDYLSR